MCDMWKGEVDEVGCFASHASVTTLEGDRTVHDLRVGDLVKSVTLGDVGVGVGVVDKVLGAGTVVWSRVIFLHDHTQRAATLELTVGEKGGVSRRHLQMTAPHLVRVRQRQQGVDIHTNTHTHDKLLPARNVRVGDRVYVADGGFVGLEEVLDVRAGKSLVRYVVTDNDNILIDGVAATVYATRAGWVETLPFRFLDRLLPGVFSLSLVKGSVRAMLESPVARWFESVVNADRSKTSESASASLLHKLHTPAPVHHQSLMGVSSVVSGVWETLISLQGVYREHVPCF